MIIKVIFAALLALSCIAPTSCSKENKQTSMNLTSESHTGRVIRYSVNGADYRCVIRNNEDWITPISNILALSREGFTIRITDENHAYGESLTKKTVTLTRIHMYRHKITLFINPWTDPTIRSSKKRTFQ